MPQFRTRFVPQDVLCPYRGWPQQQGRCKYPNRALASSNARTTPNDDHRRAYEVTFPAEVLRQMRQAVLQLLRYSPWPHI